MRIAADARRKQAKAVDGRTRWLLFKTYPDLVPSPILGPCPYLLTSSFIEQ